MTRRLALVWAISLSCWAGTSTQAQSTVAGTPLPSRTSLSRLGLERQWITMAPVAGTERVLRISRGRDLLFVQTSEGILHVYEAETGKPLWSVQIGEPSTRALSISQNSYAVFASSANILSAMDKATGRIIWRENLSVLPTSGTAANDEHLLVGLENSMVRCYDLKEAQPKGPDKIRAKPAIAWDVATGGPIHTRPTISDQLACFGSSDGKVYVNLTHEATPLFRIPTGGPIGKELATHDTRVLLIPSADHDLYAVDVLTAQVLWTFPTGAPISQGPIVAQDEIFVINDGGSLSSLETKTGSAKWTVGTDEGNLLGVSPTKVYLLSQDNDLMVVARDSGKVLLDPAATFQRAGLNLRDFTVNFPAKLDDRLYLATPSGLLMCLREIGATTPHLLRHPQTKPFGYVPPEGIKAVPNPFEEAPSTPADPNAPAPAEVNPAGDEPKS